MVSRLRQPVGPQTDPSHVDIAEPHELHDDDDAGSRSRSAPCYIPGPWTPPSGPSVICATSSCWRTRPSGPASTAIVAVIPIRLPMTIVAGAPKAPAITPPARLEMGRTPQN